MLRARLLPVVLLVSCSTATETTDPSTQPPAAASAVAAPSGASGTATLDAEIAQTAVRAARVDEIKLRLADDGRVLKQSLYHGDAASIPQPVKDLAAERFPKAAIKGYETELYADLGRVYEVEVLEEGSMPCEVAATPEGKEVYTECEIDPATLSAAAKATLDALAPGGTILEAETKVGEGVDETTVEVETAGGELYVRLDSAGALIQAMRRIPAVVEVPLP